MTQQKDSDPQDLTIENTLQLDRQLCFALYTAANRMTRLYRPFLDKLGITYSQYLTLLVLWENDDLQVGEIGSALGLDSGTLTPLLKRLETAGIVMRRRDPQDERRVRVSLTDQGKALRSDVEDIPVQVACQLALPLEELMQLHTLVRKFNASFEES